MLLIDPAGLFGGPFGWADLDQDRRLVNSPTQHAATINNPLRPSGMPDFIIRHTHPRGKTRLIFVDDDVHRNLAGAAAAVVALYGAQPALLPHGRGTVIHFPDPAYPAVQYADPLIMRIHARPITRLFRRELAIAFGPPRIPGRVLKVVPYFARA